MKKLVSLILGLTISLSGSSFVFANDTDTLKVTNPTYGQGSYSSYFSTSDDGRGRAKLSAVLPPKFDLRDSGYVTPVKDQGLDGDCWAYAATSSLESDVKHFQGVEKDFSESHLTDNIYNNSSNPWSFDITTGGNRDMATAYFSRGTGPVNEAGYTKGSMSTAAPVQILDSAIYIPDVDKRVVPITEATKAEASSKDWYNKMALDGYTVVYEGSFTPEAGDLSFTAGGYTYYRLGEGTQRNRIKEAIYTNGAVYSSYTSRSNQNDYQNFYNSSTYAFYYNGTAETDHAITIVGWDDTFSKGNFKITPPGDGAWIIKNNWGTDSSNGLDNGYMYISYYDTRIGESSTVFKSAGSTGNLNTIYQYDPFGATAFAPTGSSFAWIVNRFESKRIEGEYIDRVGVYVYDMNTTCSIAIKTYDGQRDETVPVFGDDDIIKSETFEYPGYYTIELDNPIEVNGYFDVAVKEAVSSGTLTLSVERNYPQIGVSKATANAGESYFRINGSWQDLTAQLSGANVCIKAFSTTNLNIPKYTVNNFTLTDMQGNEIAKPQSGNFMARVSVTKDIIREAQDYIIIAAYDKGGQYIGFSFMQMDIQKGQTVNFGTMINIPKGTELGSLKAFVWDGLDTMTPLSKDSTL